MSSTASTDNESSVIMIGRFSQFGVYRDLLRSWDFFRIAVAGLLAGASYFWDLDMGCARTYLTKLIIMIYAAGVTSSADYPNINAVGLHLFINASGSGLPRIIHRIIDFMLAHTCSRLI